MFNRWLFQTLKSNVEPFSPPPERREANEPKRLVTGHPLTIRSPLLCSLHGRVLYTITVNTTQRIPSSGLHSANGESFRAKDSNDALHVDWIGQQSILHTLNCPQVENLWSLVFQIFKHPRSEDGDASHVWEFYNGMRGGLGGWALGVWAKSAVCFRLARTGEGGRGMIQWPGQTYTGN